MSNLDFFCLIRVFSGFEALSECSLEYRECCFGNVSPMIFFLVIGFGEFSSILPANLPFLFLTGICHDILADRAVYPLGVVSLIPEIAGNFSVRCDCLSRFPVQSGIVCRVLGDRRC